MVGRDKLDEVADALFKATTSDELEVVVITEEYGLTRYANSKIHQNVGQKNISLSIRAVQGKKIGSASTNSLDERRVKETLKMAEKIARHQREDHQFKGLAEDRDLKEPKVSSHYKSTLSYTPENRAAAVKDVIDLATDAGVDRVYGSLLTGETGVYVTNTNDIRRKGEITKANLTVTAIADWGNDRGFGWSEFCTPDIEQLKAEEVARIAVEKGLSNIEMTSVEPGEYTVVLEPLAARDLLLYMSFMGFSARTVQEQRSFLNGRFGEKIMDEDINISDDVEHKDMMGLPFDFEGVPKERVGIIEDGVAKNVVYDSYTAGREEGKHSTGHALPMPSPSSPITTNLVLEKGDTSLEKMVESTDKGILVTRFNYCGVVHPVKSILTGLTRDGTWLIEDGEIKNPLRNLRFTQNLMDAFSNVEAIGNDHKLFSLEFYPIFVLCPALKIDEFNFTGTTKF